MSDNKYRFVDEKEYKYNREVLKTSLENMADVLGWHCQNYSDCESQCPNNKICEKMHDLYSYILWEEMCEQ